MRSRPISLVGVFTLVLAAGTMVGTSSGYAAQSDEAIANAGLVVQTDLPPGYVPSTDDDDGPDIDIEKVAKKIPSCTALTALAALDDGEGSNGVEVEGTDFEHVNTGDLVGSEVSVYATEGPARVGIAALRSPAMSRCIPTLMKQAFELGFASAAKDLSKKQRRLLKDIDVDVSTINGPGDDGLTYRMTIQMGILPGTPIYMDMVFLRTGRAVGLYSFLAMGALPTVEATVLPAVTQRLAAAQV